MTSLHTQYHTIQQTLQFTPVEFERNGPEPAFTVLGVFSVELPIFSTEVLFWIFFQSNGSFL